MPRVSFFPPLPPLFSPPFQIKSADSTLRKHTERAQRERGYTPVSISSSLLPSSSSSSSLHPRSISPSFSLRVPVPGTCAVTLRFYGNSICILVHRTMGWDGIGLSSPHGKPILPFQPALLFFPFLHSRISNKNRPSSLPMRFMRPPSPPFFSLGGDDILTGGMK